MVEVSRHEPGSFSWAELATTDPAAAKAFYSALFGWKAVDSPMGPGPEDVYTRLQLGGKDVAALYPMMKDQREQGVPPNWMCYVTVENADASASKARELGGKLLAEPFDVATYGRMAIIQDPENAVLAVWQPRDLAGIGRINEPGALCWCELATREPDRAARFYTQLFGWGLKSSPGYTELTRGGTPIGGLFTMTQEMSGIPPYWTIYFQVTDCDASLQKAKSSGGRPLFGPKDVEGVGRFAAIQDPQGASFSIIQLK